METWEVDQAFRETHTEVLWRFTKDLYNEFLELKKSILDGSLKVKVIDGLPTSGLDERHQYTTVRDIHVAILDLQRFEARYTGLLERIQETQREINE